MIIRFDPPIRPPVTDYPGIAELVGTLIVLGSFITLALFFGG